MEPNFNLIVKYNAPKLLSKPPILVSVLNQKEFMSQSSKLKTTRNKAYKLNTDLTDRGLVNQEIIEYSNESLSPGLRLQSLPGRYPLRASKSSLETITNKKSASPKGKKKPKFILKLSRCK